MLNKTAVVVLNNSMKYGGWTESLSVSQSTVTNKILCFASKLYIIAVKFYSNDFFNLIFFHGTFSIGELKFASPRKKICKP